MQKPTKSCRASSAACSRKGGVKVLLADDHPVVRQGLKSCLSQHEWLKIVGEASDGEEAVEKALQLSPDVVLMDISMPRVSGFDATERLRQQAPSVKVLVLSAHNNREYLLRMVQAGAHGFISKEASTDELLEAIDSVHSGQTFFSPEVAGAVMQQLVRNGGNFEPFAQLTAREREVLALIAEGKTNKEVAGELNIGLRTVETHREQLMRRLDIHSVAGLTKFAIAKGLIPLEVTAPCSVRVLVPSAN